MMYRFLPGLMFAGVAALIGTLAMHASSLARNTLQALAPAILELLAAWFLMIVGFALWHWTLVVLTSESLGYLIAGPLMLSALVVLMYKNFRIMQPGWKNGAVNSASLLGTLLLGLALSSAVYHRIWEKLTPSEPPHGRARLALARPPVFNEDLGEVSIRLPDGTIRFWPRLTISGGENPLAVLLGNFKVSPGEGQLMAGSNWVCVNRSIRELIGIKTDGTLWVSETPSQPAGPGNGQRKANAEAMYHLVQFGTETNWSSLARNKLTPWLVKRDGTLWIWGDRKFVNSKSSPQPWPGLRHFTPRQLGTESNWAEVFPDRYLVGLRKLDGTGWATGDRDSDHQATRELEPGLVLYSAPILQRHTFRSRTMISSGTQFMAGISTNGTFRIFANQILTRDPHTHFGTYEWRSADWQIGHETNWLAVAGGWEKAVTLRDDGTLWLWDFRHNRIRWTVETGILIREIQATRPVRLGTHADWVAIASRNNNLITLAADGSLWFWPLQSAEDFYNLHNDTSRNYSLLDISRKPRLLGNVFDQTGN